VRLRPAAALLIVVALAAGCESDAAPRPEVSSAAPVRLAWSEATLPSPPGVAGRLVVRDVATCPGRFFVVGAVRGAAGGTRPAAWSSADGRSWVSLRIEARTYYGRQNILSSVACRDARVAALGAKVGGAHGNPRTSSWQQTPDGVLREVTAPFELFGGPQAVNVSRLDAGPPGWLISGNRMSGAAAWVSRDASSFRIVERAPNLASGPGGETWAFDGTAAAGGWLIVGGVQPEGRIDRDAGGWQSSDGVAWQPLPSAGATGDYEELQRVVGGAAPVAVGVRGGRFGAWRLDGGVWQPAGAFGAVAPAGLGGVRALVASGSRLFCVTSDGAAYALWSSPDGGRSWGSAALPAPVAAGPESAVALAAEGGTVLAVTDQDAGGRVYLAETAG
jgi:hypothetical protein